MSPRPYRAVCFDFDYTLADCTASIVAGFEYGFRRLGYPAPGLETVRRTVGFLLEDSYANLTGDRNPEHQALFRAYFQEASREQQIRDTVLFPGAEDLLRALKGAGIRSAIISTKRGETIRAILDRRGLLDLTERIIGSEHVHRPKPDPEGLLAAMAELEASPGEFLYCGDTVMDAEAARRAGCDFAAVLNGPTEAEAFLEYSPVLTAPGLPDLQRWLGL